MAGFGEIVTFLPIPVAASLAGSGLAFASHPSRRAQSAVQHFAAGAIVAGTTVELLPQLRGQSSIAVAAGWILGVAVMLVLRQIFGRLERRAGDDSRSLVYVSLVDVFIDGFLYSLGFSAGTKAGLILAVALSIEAIFLALTVSSNARPLPLRQRTLIALSLPALLATGAAIGGLLVSTITGTPLVVLIAIGAVALLYLVVEELLVEAHEVADTTLAIVLFFAAFLLILLLETAA